MMKILRKLFFKILFRPEKDFDLGLENPVLPQQVVILKRSVKRPQLRSRDRFFWMLLSHFWNDWRQALIIVKPETVVRWHKKVSSCFGDLSPGTKDQSPQPGQIGTFRQHLPGLDQVQSAVHEIPCWIDIG